MGRPGPSPCGPVIPRGRGEGAESAHPGQRCRHQLGRTRMKFCRLRLFGSLSRGDVRHGRPASPLAPGLVNTFGSGHGLPVHLALFGLSGVGS